MILKGESPIIVTMKKYRIMFVCLGNICRSPLAAGLLTKHLSDQGLSDRVRVDSAGTHDYQIGRPADPYSITVAGRKACDISAHRARQFQVPDDFLVHDLVIAMDSHNQSCLQQIGAGHFDCDVFMLTDFCEEAGINEIEDPYRQDLEAFVRTAERIERCFPGLIAEIQHRLV